MSVVACKITENEIIIGSDSAMSVNGRRDIPEMIKLAKLSKITNLYDTENPLDIIIGLVGSAAEGELFKAYLESEADIPRPIDYNAIMNVIYSYNMWRTGKVGLSTDPADGGSSSCSAIMVLGGKAYVVEPDARFAAEIQNFHAIGSGEDFALTALHLGYTVDKAISEAIIFDIYCGGDIVKYTVKK